MGYVRGEAKGQATLFPVSLDELVPAEHLCRVIEAFVAQLDLGILGFSKAEPAATGRPGYDPADLLKLYLYGYLHQVRSSRRLEQECRRNVEVMWLLGRLVPDHKTIAEFRRYEGRALRETCASFVRLLRAAGVVRAEWVAIDGSKFQAVASPNAVLWEEDVAAERGRLEQQASEYLTMLDAADAAEASEVPSREAVRAALGLLEQQHAQLAVGRARGEPEARLLRGQRGPSYNVQAAVDAAHGVIVAHAVTDEASDNRSLQPMAEAARAAVDATTLNVVADAGYSNGAQAEALEAQGIMPHVPANRSANTQGGGTLFDRSAFEYDAHGDRYRCPGGAFLERKQRQARKHRTLYIARASDCGACVLRPRCTAGEQRYLTRHWHDEALLRMQARATPERMRLRSATAERPFAELKHRIFEKPRFLLRGRWGAGTEMTIAVLAYNLKQALRALGCRGLMESLAAA
jgi:transposase